MPQLRFSSPRSVSDCTMDDYTKKPFLAGTMILVAVVLCFPIAVNAEAAFVSNSVNAKQLGVLQGVVRDQAGNPIADATVAVFKAGTSKLLRQVRSAADGKYLIRMLPGTYTILAVAQGYNPFTLTAVEIGKASELDYGFKLERAGSGNTLPEKRLDRSNPKWVIRSAQNSRSIYQNRDGETPIDETNAEIDQRADDERRPAGPGQSVVETTFTAREGVSSLGVNYATFLQLDHRVDLLVAVQAAVGRSAAQRIESQLKLVPNDDHQLRFRAAIGSFGSMTVGHDSRRLGQLNLQASDEWRVSEGLILVYGVDYARFLGAGDDSSLSPRLGLQYDVDSKTRFRSAYTTDTEERTWSREIYLEGTSALFREPASIEDLVIEEGAPRMAKSTRFEFGIERVLDNRSNIEANAFFDTTANRGLGLMSIPFESAGTGFSEFIGNQTGGAHGLRVVYTRRLGSRFSASGGYSAGLGQQLSAEDLSDPESLFKRDIFQTLFGQFDADFETGTTVSTVFRLSPDAAVFAIDPFRGRLAIYDPSLSILVTQSLPTLGLPFRAEAVIDARKLFDFQIGATTEAGQVRWSGQRRTLRGGVLVRF
ncbi:hypothetical protein BH24ACI3_BH24ACI3_01140 [soil metagenome]